MDFRDRLANLGLLAAAALTWAVVWSIVNTVNPDEDPVGGLAGAIVIGAAIGLTAAPLIWLVAFARQRRIAYQGDWVRALRRGGWIALVALVWVGLRLQGIEGAFQIPIVLFVAALVAVVETTLSTGR